MIHKYQSSFRWTWKKQKCSVNLGTFLRCSFERKVYWSVHAWWLIQISIDLEHIRRDFIPSNAPRIHLNSANKLPWVFWICTTTTTRRMLVYALFLPCSFRDEETSKTRLQRAHAPASRAQHKASVEICSHVFIAGCPERTTTSVPLEERSLVSYMQTIFLLPMGGISPDFMTPRGCWWRQRRGAAPPGGHPCLFSPPAPLAPPSILSDEYWQGRSPMFSGVFLSSFFFLNRVEFFHCFIMNRVNRIWQPSFSEWIEVLWSLVRNIRTIFAFSALCWRTMLKSNV